jgi:hypothetical protein
VLFGIAVELIESAGTLSRAVPLTTLLILKIRLLGPVLPRPARTFVVCLCLSLLVVFDCSFDLAHLLKFIFRRF